MAERPDFAGVVNGHRYVPTALRGVSKCSCGLQLHGMPHDHRAHLAEALNAELDLWLGYLLDVSCHHCGRMPEADGDHTCLCPKATGECFEHLAYPVVSRAALAALTTTDPKEIR